MSSRLDRSESRRRTTSHAPASLEALEPRIVLSGTGLIEAAGRAAPLTWSGSEISVIENSWIVTFERPVTEAYLGLRASSIARQLGASLESSRRIGLGYSAVLSLTSPVSEGSVRSVSSSSFGLKSIEPNLVYTPSLVPNDPFFTQQWQLENTGQNVPGSGPGTIGADSSLVQAWDITTGSPTVAIAVIDTGVDLDHPDLAANIWRNPGEIAGNGIDDDGNGFVDDVSGWDFGELDNSPDDAAGHGTAVAGTIGAVGNNGIGVSGVAWTIGIVPMKIADQFGALSLDAIVGAHDYLTMMRGRGHNIVASNNSYGAFAPQFYEDTPGAIAERDAIARFIESGGVFVASAGNAGNNNDEEFTNFPASYDVPGIIAVAATDNNDALAGFSSYGPQTVDLAAPGVNVRTTAIGGGYTYISGTSFSGPMVAGAVGLLRTVRPDASGEELRRVLIESSDPLPSLQTKVVSGGRLNVAEALRIIGLDGPVVTSIAPGPVTGQVGADGSAINRVTVTFNRDLNGSLIDAGFVSLVGDGTDNTFGTGDDRTIPLGSVTLTGPRTVTIQLNLQSFLQQRLPVDRYRLTLNPAGFRDTDGNFLNGDAVSGTPEVYDFLVVSPATPFEPNDSLGQATPASFSASGSASFTGLTIGDGVRAGLDVDLFKVTIPRGGLIRASVIAQNRLGGSELDSYVRLFDAFGQELASNDQFNGADALVDYFVSTGGIYYVGVSGFGNASYNPNAPGSGQTQSTGVYDLLLEVELIQEDRVTLAQDFGDDPPRLPPQGTQGTLSDSLVFNDARSIRDVNVRVDIDHDYTSDLRISLISPQGTEVVLANRRGGDGNDYTGTLFDDEATKTIAQGVAPFTGSFRPETALSTLDGVSAAGLWTLVIQDAQALNSGFLLDWSLDFTLDNDIFGAFESNDTIATATDLAGIDGTGTASVSASIGDGGFGVLDRDLFRIDVGAGTTLQAAATSGGSLDAALRLFDEAGQELKRVNPAGTLDATITNFVFPEGGTFYLAVSESANVAYDPFDVTSGVAAQSTGSYTLGVAVIPGVSDPALVLSGEVSSFGTGSDGSFGAGAGASRTGLSLGGQEFLFDADNANAPILHFFGASVAGFTFRNDGAGGDSGIPVSLTDQSDAFNRRVVGESIFRGLRVQRSVSQGIQDGFVVVDVMLTNTTASPLTGLTWMEAFNPQQGLNLLQGTTASTSNDVLAGQPAAMASFSNNLYPSGLTAMLAAPDSDARATATFFDPSRTIRDPSVLLADAVNDPDGATGDLAMALAYDLADLAAGKSTSLRYFVLMGDSEQQTLDLYGQINDGTGTGHLTADPAHPAEQALSIGGNDGPSTAPTLPYRAFYPEGFANGKTSTFVPILNPHDRPVRVVVLARYETGDRDQVLADQTIPAGQRGGITITTPALFAAGDQLVRATTPYAIEIRAELPVAATFSHYDLFLSTDGPAAVGESFTNRIDDTWTFGSVARAPGVSDFLLFTNTTDHTIKVTTTFYPTSGSTPVSITQNLGAFRRGGINVKKVVGLPADTYGVRVEAQGEIVAVLSHFDKNTGVASGVTGTPGGGDVRGAIPEGQVGINSVSEIIGVVNPGTSSATVTFSFLFQSGTAYRTVLTVPAQRRAQLDVMALPNFPVGEPYSVFFESTRPVTLNLPTDAFGDEFASEFSDKAYTLWGFGEGFRPKREGVVTEYLRLFNPQEGDVLVEITLHFDGGLGEETFRRTLPARRVQEFDVHDFVTGDKRNKKVFYGITVKAAQPVVAYMAHYDSFFPGGFGTLGAPLGTSVGV